MDREIGWIASAVFLCVGVAFLVASLQIPAGTAMTLGPGVVPTAMSVAVIALAGVALVLDLRRPQPGRAVTLRDLLTGAVPLVLLVAAYAQTMVWVGYLPATVLAAVAAFRLFGNPWSTSLLHGGIGGAAFYVIFIRAMGIYDPPGTLFDSSAWLM